MESYNTEEEQVEALRRWWDDNGRSIILAVVVALSAGFGWKSWQASELENTENASNIYQAMLQSIDPEQATVGQQTATTELALQLKTEYAGSSYAQFAALHLASIAVAENNLVEAETQLRWVLSKADKGGDVAQITELRLARVLAAADKADRALEILQQTGSGSFAASYAMARGDVLLQLGRVDEARDAYSDAKSLVGQSEGQVSLATLEQKLQSLNPRPAREIGEIASDAVIPAAAPVSGTEAIDAAIADGEQ